MRQIRDGSFLLASLGLNSTYFNAVLRTHFKIDDDTVLHPRMIPWMIQYFKFLYLKLLGFLI